MQVFAAGLLQCVLSSVVISVSRSAPVMCVCVVSDGGATESTQRRAGENHTTPRDSWDGLAHTRQTATVSTHTLMCAAGVLSGAHLSVCVCVCVCVSVSVSVCACRAELASLQRELASLSERYSQKCVDLTRAQQHSLDAERLVSQKDTQMEQLKRDNQVPHKNIQTQTSV